MGPASKDLLPLEKRDSSSFSIGIARPQFLCITKDLLICKNKALVSRNRTSHPDTKSFPATSVPASQVLGRVKDFLVAISEANRRLEIDAKENPGNYDIEVLDGNASQIIEMDLMLGIADLHTPEAIAAVESSIAGYKPADSLSASSSGTDSEYGSDDDEDDNDSDGGGDHGGENSSVHGELKKHNSLGDASIKVTGKNHSKRQSKQPKIVELP